MIKQLLTLFSILLIFSCSKTQENKLPVYAWLGGPGMATDEELKEAFVWMKNVGIDGLMYNGGHDPKTYARVGKIAKRAELKFYAWIPAMIQNETPELKAEWYAVNGKGASAFTHPPYVGHYKFLCPNREEVYQYLAGMYGAVADVPEVDGIHLDYIRFPDVILGKGLWEKYGLVMDREYPEYDYCYCDKCVSDFKQKTGIDIQSVDDPSNVPEWKQYRCDLITRMVNRLAKLIHSKGKQINAAVFPGPGSVAKRTVRQEWDKWDLDAVFPMNYNDFYLEGPEWVGTVTKEEITALEGKIPLYSGLFICPDPNNKSKENDPENLGLLPEELATAIRLSVANGASGICLFTPGRMTGAHWKAFKKAIWGINRGDTEAQSLEKEKNLPDKKKLSQRLSDSAVNDK